MPTDFKVSPLTSEYAQPAMRYYESTQAIADFLGYLVSNVDPDKKPTKAQMTALMEQFPLVWELLFERLVDNFLNYVSDSLAMLFTKRPEMLKSEGTLTYKEVLEYPTREELIAAITERKVIALSFKGLRDLNDDLEKRYALSLFPISANLERAVILVEKRNLIAHNRGIVNRRYLQNVPSATEKLGDKLSFPQKYVLEEQRFLSDSVTDIADRVLNKFF